MKVTEQCVVALTWTLRDTLGEDLDVLDEPVEFLVRGDDLLEKIEIKRSYGKSDTLQVMRILKNYDLLKDAQLDMFPDRPVTPARRVKSPA